MLPQNYHKRSFLRFDCDIDTDKLLQEFKSIDSDAWESTYWGSVHCSIGMLLLRGGNRGNEFDFFSDEVFDKPILKGLPYIDDLLSSNGPFGKAHYAFIFKMQPNGVTLTHQDTIEKWYDMYRIHVPIITNPDAHLIVNEQSQHLSTAYAWSFDNQADHGVVNGNEERVHLIFDVPYSDKIANKIDAADCLSGERVDSHIRKISGVSKAVESYPGDDFMRNGIQVMRNQGQTSSQIAAFINSKKIPTKSYPVSAWDESMVDALL
jgi:hypothetical protein